MKYILIVGFYCLLLSSCVAEPQQSTKTVNGVKVDYLFEKDGIRVYRFMDDGNYHYFTTKGETITTQHSGKTSRQENIN